MSGRKARKKLLFPKVFGAKKTKIFADPTKKSFLEINDSDDD